MAKPSIKSPSRTKAVELVRITARIVAAYVSTNSVKAEELTKLLQFVYDAVCAIADNGTGNQDPAVPIAKSITDDYLVCLEDGKKLKMLKRYLRTHFGLSPDEYRRKWGLPANYPMAAPNYSAGRSRLAKEIGLGRRKRPKSKASRKSAKKAFGARNV